MKKILTVLLVLLALMGIAYAWAGSNIDVGVSLPGNTGVQGISTWDTTLGNASVNYIAWPAGYNLIVLMNVTGLEATYSAHIDVLPGDNPPAFQSYLGNYTIPITSADSKGVYFIGPLESARFRNATGYLNIGTQNVTGTQMYLKVAHAAAQ